MTTKVEAKAPAQVEAEAPAQAEAPPPSSLRAWQQVEVADGEFKGYAGVVLSAGSADAVLVKLDLMGSQVFREDNLIVLG